MTNPTGYTALDLIGFTDKGTYASNVAYVKNDIVHYTGSLWRCKVDDTTNVTPGENANWTAFIGEPQSLVERIIAPLEDNPATVAYLTGRQIIYDDWLWEVIADIAVGDVLVDYAVDPTNANIKKADPVETQLLAIKAKEGNLTNLTTTAKADLVSAINEVDGEIGNLSSLDTTVKTSAVAAINEVNTKVSKTEDLISIVENGNTCTHTGGIFAGQYVNWKGDLYTADSNISVGATFASSGGSKNLTAVVDGGLNQLLKIKRISSGIVTPTNPVANGYNYTFDYSSNVQSLINNNHRFLTTIAEITYGNESFSSGTVYLINQPDGYKSFAVTSDANHLVRIDVIIFYI